MADDREKSPLLTGAEAAPRGLNGRDLTRADVRDKSPLLDGADAEAALRGPHGLDLTWAAVSLTVTTEGGCVRRTTRTIEVLQGVSGRARAGQTLAVMGPSGAGKSSLLNILAGRTRCSTGTIAVNGQPVEPAVLQSLSVYVQQDDVLLGTFTPREVITFSARLRLPRSMSLAAKLLRVRELISSLGIQRCADSPIKGISGGERKRTSIGVELVTDPQLLFLDEPTSGLDSSAALSVMTLVTDLAAKEGRTVVTTIHQPSSEIFGRFQRLMLISLGEVAYDGPASSALDYFASIGLPCPTYTNPADHFIKALSVTADPATVEQVRTITGRLRQRKEVALEDEGMDQSPRVTVNGAAASVDMLLASKPQRASLLEESTQLAWRSLRNFLREPLTFQVRLIQTVFVALLVALLYWDLGTNQASISDRTGAMFFIVISMNFSSSMSLVLAFPIERKVFMREQDNNMYNVLTYYLGKVVSELPFQLMFPLVFGVIVYWAVGFSTVTATKFLVFYLGLLLLSLLGQSVGMFFGCILPTPEAAIQLTPMYQTVTMTFGGFFVAIDSLPVWFAWLAYLSPYRYGFEFLLVNEYTGLELYCEEDELRNGVCPFTAGEAVLKAQGIESDDLVDGAIALAVMAVGFHIMAYTALAWQVYRRRTTTLRD